ncbi:hypothetical protein EPN87_03460 [archaeon]|nr:MAG: hypothetical protein EPN87_03460 [archaeon]
MTSYPTDSLFPNKRTGIIPALDISLVYDNPRFEHVVTSTADIPGVIGYKLSGLYSIRRGLEETVSTLTNAIDSLNKNLSRRHKKILDYQKLGGDGGTFMKGMIKDIYDLVDGIIIFPWAGPLGQKAVVEEIRKNNKVPIAGGKVTFIGAPESEGGHIPESAITRMYLNSILLDVPNFVLPASRPEDCQQYKSVLGKMAKEADLNLSFYPTGLGKDQQGGDLIKTYDILHPINTYFILGREVAESPNPRETATRLTEALLQHDKELVKS